MLVRWDMEILVFCRLRIVYMIMAGFDVEARGALHTGFPVRCGVIYM